MHWFTHRKMAVTLMLGLSCSLLLSLYGLNQGLADSLKRRDQSHKRPAQTQMQAHVQPGQVPQSSGQLTQVSLPLQKPSGQSGDVYEHCLRALRKAGKPARVEQEIVKLARAGLLAMGAD